MKLLKSTKTFRKLIHLATFLAFAGGILLGILAKHGYLLSLDQSISIKLQAWQGQWFIDIAYVISSLEYAIFALSAACLIILIYKRRRGEVAIVMLAIMSLVIPTLLKHIFGIERPGENIVDPLYKNIEFFNVSSTGALGFPSGHAYEYAVMLGALLMAMLSFIKIKVIRYVLVLSAVILVFLVGVSRISLGAHYFSQVLGGYLFATSVLCFLSSLRFLKSLHRN